MKKSKNVNLTLSLSLSLSNTIISLFILIIMVNLFPISIFPQDKYLMSDDFQGEIGISPYWIIFQNGNGDIDMNKYVDGIYFVKMH